MKRYAEELGRKVVLRNGCDQAIFDLVFDERAHVPPEWMPVPSTVLDLGANVGLTAAHYQAMWPEARIVAVEMDEKNIRALQQNYDGQVVHCAVTASTKTFVRYDSHTLPASYALSENGDIEVEGATLGEIIDLYFGGPVDLVKMDIEGEEWNVLRTSDWVPYVRHLMVEFHREGSDVLENAIVLLESLGFEAVVHHAGRKAVFAWNTASRS